MNKYIIVIFATLLSFTLMGQNLAQVTSTRQLTSSNSYFPQINAQGTHIIYSDTEARNLYIQGVDSGARVTIANEGLPGFEARFSPEGKVYYITMRVNENRLVFRSAHEYDPETGNARIVLGEQHGALHAINGTNGMVVVGENKVWNESKAGTYAWTLGTKLYIVKNGKRRSYSPVLGCIGYLWASVSPDGSKVAFEASGKGLYVVDAGNGRVLMHTGEYVMPCWYNNDFLVAQTHGFRIALIRAGDGVSQNLAGGGCCMPAVGGGKIVYTTKNGVVNVMTIELNP